MPFSVPTDIAGCLLWLKADAGVYKDAGSTLAADTETVQQWNDQSGSGNHYSQATSGRRPVYRTGIRASLPVLQFDATDDSLGGMSITSGDFTIFIVYIRRNGTGGNHRALNGSNNWLVGPWGTTHGAYMNGFINDNSPETNVFQDDAVACCVTRNSTTGKFYLGNVDRTSGNATGFPGTLNIGGGIGAFAEPLDGDIGEVIVYNSVLSAGDRADVFNYLASRWKVRGNSVATTGPGGVSGCIAWLDAAVNRFKDGVETVPADTETVQFWRDKCGNNWVFRNLTSGNRPTYRTNIVNSLPVLRFDGTTDYLDSLIKPAAPFTIFVVTAKKGATTSLLRLLNAATFSGWYVGTISGHWEHSAGGVAGGTGSSAAADAFHLVTIRNTGSATAFRVDQTDYTSDATKVTNPAAFLKLSNDSEFWNGDIAEVAIFDSALGTTDRLLVENYFGTKYNLFSPTLFGPSFRVTGLIG